VDDQEQSRWQPTRRQVLWTTGTVAAVTVAVLIGYPYGITLWDWIKLLIVPAVIAGGGLWFNQQQQERQREDNQQQQERQREDNRLQRDRELEIAKQRAQDEALQAYLDEMSQLLTDKDRLLCQAKEHEEARTLARARTLTVLARLDGERKWSVLMFLQEAELISIKDGPVVSLKWANLQDAHLGEVVLEGADLRETKLQRAWLYAAKLRGARLDKVNLSGANLAKADLSGADLSGADLSDARGLTEVQLTKAESLEGATMPDSQKYEDWLKSKVSGEDGENSGSS
jgi:uncharacterized protein YjbI with pentapeptide repeats